MKVHPYIRRLRKCDLYVCQIIARVNSGSLLTLSWRANQWTDFYMITASVMKELNKRDELVSKCGNINRFTLNYYKKIWTVFPVLVKTI